MSQDLWFTPRWWSAQPRSTVETQLAAILEGQQKIMAQIDNLKNAVAAEETEIGAVVTYLQGVPALIAEAVTNANGDNDALQASLDALQAQITTDTTNLATAVQAAPSASASAADTDKAGDPAPPADPDPA